MSNAAPAEDPWADLNPVKVGLTLIANGFSPLLVKMASEGGKVPMLKGWREGKVTPERWKRELSEPYSGIATGIGIRTGEVVCVDFDITNDHPELLDEVRKAVFAVLGRSDFIRSGNKGYAIIYRTSTPIKKIRVAAVAPDEKKQAVEFLGEGQQFVVAGLAKPQRFYSWDNEFLGASPMLAKLVDVPEVTPDQIRAAAAAARAVFVTKWGDHKTTRLRDKGEGEPAEYDPDSASAFPPFTVQMIRDMLDCIDPSSLTRLGNVETGELGWSNVAAGLKAAKVCCDEGDEWDPRGEFVSWSQSGDNFKSEADCYGIFDKVPDYALKVGGLVKLAQDGGYKWPPGHFGQPTPPPFEDSLMGRHGDEIERMLSPSTFGDWESFSSLFRKAPKPIEWAFPQYIEKGVVTFLSGPGGTNKSRLAIQFGCSIAAGAMMWGLTPQRAPFVYLSSEDDEDEVVRRAQAIKARLNLPDELPDARYWDLRGKESRLAVVEEGGGFTLQPFYSELRTRLLAISGHKFVAVDSCYDFVSFKGKAKIDEGSVNAFIKLVLGQLCVETDSTFLVLWHPSQSGQEREDASGWSVAWVNSPRARLSISQDKDDPDAYTLKVVKLNHGPKGQEIKLYWDSGALMHVQSTSRPDIEVKIRRTCIDLAKLYASKGQPLTKQKKITTEFLNEVEKRCGHKTTATAAKGYVQAAMLEGALIYLSSDRSVPAGYYDAADGEAQEEAGRQARRAAANVKTKRGSEAASSVDPLNGFAASSGEEP